MIVKLVVLIALAASPAFCSAGIKGYSQQREEVREATKGGRLLAPVEQQRLLATESRVEEPQQPLLAEQKIEEAPQQREEAPKGELKALRYEARPQVQREEQRELSKTRAIEQAPIQVVQKEERLESTKAEPQPIQFAQKEERYEPREPVKGRAPEAPQVQYTQQREERYEQREAVKGRAPEVLPQVQYTQQREERYEQREALKTRAPEPQYTQQREERFEPQQRETYEAREEVQQQQVEVRQERQEQRRLEEAPIVQQSQATYDEVRESQQQPIEQYPVKGAPKGVAAPVGEPEPYAFSYQVEGSSRSESGDTKGVVRGQYTLQGGDGSSRVVDYVADHNGFRASVNTNEFGTESKAPANVALRTSQPNAEDITLRLESKTREAPAQGVKGLFLPPRLEAVKGTPLLQPAAPVPQAPVLYEETKSKRYAEEPLRVAPAPAKGRVEEAPAAPAVQEPIREQAPAKSAELVKAAPSRPVVSAELKAQPEPRSFESAHRSPAPYRAHAVPVPVPVYARPTRVQPVAVNRGYYPRERYPPSPVQGYRRDYEVPRPVVPVNPRVSFYAPSSSASVASVDEDHSNFDQPESS